MNRLKIGDLIGLCPHTAEQRCSVYSVASGKAAVYDDKSKAVRHIQAWVVCERCNARDPRRDGLPLDIVEYTEALSSELAIQGLN